MIYIVLHFQSQFEIICSTSAARNRSEQKTFTECSQTFTKKSATLVLLSCQKPQGGSFQVCQIKEKHHTTHQANTMSWGLEKQMLCLDSYHMKMKVCARVHAPPPPHTHGKLTEEGLPSRTPKPYIWHSSQIDPISSNDANFKQEASKEQCCGQDQWFQRRMGGAKKGVEVRTGPRLCWSLWPPMVCWNPCFLPDI